MATIHLGVAGRKIGADLEPLAVSPQQACVLLSIGNTRLYELIGNGELVSYLEGRARRITMQSIRARVARLSVDPERERAGAAPVAIEAPTPEAEQAASLPQRPRKHTSAAPRDFTPMVSLRRRQRPNARTETDPGA